MEQEISIGLGGEGYVNKKIYVGENTVNFYKLDKSKKYKVEGEGGKYAVLVFIAFSAIFDLLALVLCLVFMDMLFRSTEGTVAPIMIFLFGAICTGVSVYAYLKTRGERLRVKAVLNDCTLTDGKVVECYTEKKVSDSGDARNVYYEVEMFYSFYGLDGEARYGRLSSTYSADPEFFEGQNLMVAFNDDDSVILRKFSLSEGAKEFAQAEAERLELDFSDLSGKLLDVDTSKPIKTRAYSRGYVIAGASIVGFWLVAMLPIIIVSVVYEWGVFVLLPIGLTGLFMAVPGVCITVTGLKKTLLLKRILKSPNFTKGVVFFRKSTYIGNAKKVFYRYKDKDGGCHVEKFTGQSPLPLMDGERVIVAYSGGNSVILSEYSLKRKSGRRRVR